MTLELLDTTLIQSCNNQSTEGHKCQQKSKHWMSLKQNSMGTNSQSSKKEELEFYTDLTDHFDFQIHENLHFLGKIISLIIKFIAKTLTWRGLLYCWLTLNFVCTFSNLKAGPLNLLYSSGLSKIFSKYSHCNHEYKMLWFSMSLLQQLESSSS